ncbi:hybrid sensor histidine kinase/response regulator [Massilia sp. MB5]|uniref:hybrid sensor histidine kinase/response regulator n=1 Tax=Massilia sp. MB5 TaxID=2919578 RepID=UPI001F102C5E|nr:hybrid sensor histidine kinase/response regulator [Massilia sp. MB5]UMR30622.1 hybrid sensor histidine kinase/response regulator [Massilia sp. MB5]
MSAPIHILLVDDTEANLLAVEALLTRPGVVVLKAASGPQALELLLVHEVALALVDVQMPGMDGFELAELIRGSERTRAIPLIFLTAATPEAGYSFRGYEAGAVDFMFKPIDSQALLSKVNVFVELYQQKRQMAQQMAELERALRLNEMFTAVLGHDLRTPLSVVMNGAMLLPLMTDHPKVAVTAQRIQSSARRMAQMVDQLLDLSRIRSGQLRLNAKPQDVEALCRAIADEFHPPDKPVRVRIVSQGDTQACIDAGMCSQIMSNLIGNALLHGEPEHPVQLLIDGSAAGTILLAVHNQGVIEAARLAHLFEPFQSAENRRSGQGLGLGLYTASMFARAHGGDIGVACDAALGQTVFTVTLPRRQAVEASA